MTVAELSRCRIVTRLKSQIVTTYTQTPYFERWNLFRRGHSRVFHIDPRGTTSGGAHPRRAPCPSVDASRECVSGEVNRCRQAERDAERRIVAPHGARSTT
jgi:hypothetical protein